MILRRKANLGRHLCMVGLVLLAGGVLVAQQVHYNFMPGTDFSKYHTFK